MHPPLPGEEELRKLADEELRPALEAEDERRRAELAALEDPNEPTDDVQPANSNQSTEPGALQVRPPAKAGAEQALLPAPEEEQLVLAHKLKTYEVGFLWDGDELAAEVHSQEGERVHVHRPGTFVPLMQVEGGEVFHVITDHLGTPKELIDGESRVTWSAAHGAWNNVQEQWFDDAHPRGRRVSSPFRGLGQYYDAETGLSCTRYRYWEADTGRWLSADPLGILGGDNLLGFDGCPTVDADPLGLAACNQQFKSRREALDAAYDRAGIPRGTKPDRTWTVGNNPRRRGHKGYLYSEDKGTHGTYRQFETEGGSRVIAEHRSDGPSHFHAGQPKGGEAGAARNDVDFGGGGDVDTAERYQQIDGSHHYYYPEN